MTAPALRWRQLQPADLPRVAAIAATVHPEFFEEEAIFAERRRLYPEGGWILENAAGAAGYLLSHPWRLGAVPKLNTPLDRLPERADTYYIHDIALLPEARGGGAARTIMDRVAAHAAGFGSMSLVAVNGSVPFWARLGFSVLERPDLAPLLESYGADAALMARRTG